MIQLLVSLLTTGLLLMSLLEGRLKEIAAGEGIKLHKKNLILPLSHNENRASKVAFFSIFKKKYFLIIALCNFTLKKSFVAVE